MKIIRKNVYYCEFCKKKGMSSYHMKRHEKHCTSNINRWCKMCDGNEPVYIQLVTKYKAQMEMEIEKMEFGESWKLIRKPKLQDIFDDCEGCPACVLTILRACSLCGYEWDMKFVWKTERDKWWTDNRPTDVEW